LHRLVVKREQPLRVWAEDMTYLGQFQGSRQAMEEWGTELFFQCLHLRSHRRLCVVQSGRSTSEIALACYS
jgi:hypothetical protein